MTTPQIHRFARHPVMMLAALLFCAACASAPVSVRDAELGEAFQLAVGESIDVNRTPISVRLSTVTESRCPSDVVCIQAGDADAVLTYSGAGAARTDTLHMVRLPRFSTYGGYRVDLVDVQPYPRSNLPAAVKTVTLRATAVP